MGCASSTHTAEFATKAETDALGKRVTALENHLLHKPVAAANAGANAAPGVLGQAGDKPTPGTKADSPKVEGESPRSSIIKACTSSTLAILHYNDVYNIEARKQEPVGGAAKFVTKCRELQQEHNALVLFSGDAFNPSIMSTVTHGEQMPLVLNNAGTHAACMGNHDLDFGREKMQELCEKCTFPWLMANVLDKATGEPIAPCKRYHVLTWGGITVGLVGLVEFEWLTTMPMIEIDEVDYIDFVDEGRRLARKLREEGCSVIVALTHMRMPNDHRLGAEVEEIDLILGGHDHHYEILECTPSKTLAINSGTDFRDMTLIHMEIPASGGKPTVTHEHITVTGDIADDPETAAHVNKYLEVVGSKMESEIGYTAAALDGRFSIVRMQESNLGNLVTDIMHFSMNSNSELRVDAAMLNSGTLRSDAVHGPGALRMKDAVEILPMMDELAVIELTGERLLAALENSVSQYPKLEGRFLQVSAIRFAFRPSLPSNQRINPADVFVGGQQLVLDQKYNVVTKAYLIQGKDGFECFKGVPVLRSSEDCPSLPTMIMHHFECMAKLNKLLADGQDVNTNADSILQRLLLVAEQADGNDSSSIVRFFPEVSLYMVDPAVEGRIELLKDD